MTYEEADIIVDQLEEEDDFDARMATVVALKRGLVTKDQLKECWAETGSDAYLECQEERLTGLTG